MTYQKIAKVVNRDHSTVCYGINQLPNILKQDKLLQLDYLNLSSLCETKYKKENKMGRNPYENFLTKEDLLQRSVMQYIKLKYRISVSLIYDAVLNVPTFFLKDDLC